MGHRTNWYEIGTNVALGVAMPGTCIILIYFLIACKIEAKIAGKQIDLIVDDLTSNISTLVGQDWIDAHKSEILSATTVNLTPAQQQADADVQASNAALQKSAYALGAKIVVVAAIVVAALYYFAQQNKQPFNLKTALLTNVGLTCFTSAAEILFCLTVASFYQSADLNSVYASFIEATQSWMTSN